MAKVLSQASPGLSQPGIAGRIPQGCSQPDEGRSCRKSCDANDQTLDARGQSTVRYELETIWKAPEVAPKYFGEIAALHSRSLRQRVERSGGPI
jgi:hypothetical protein